jgi:hypothetical protein
MGSKTLEFDRDDEGALIDEVSDEVLEAAAGMGVGGIHSTCSFVSAPCC